MSIDLGATIDEWNTVKVSVGLADAMYWDDYYDDDAIGIDYGGPVGPFDDTISGEIDNRGNYLRMNGFTLSTDLTGALGVDGPVSVKTKMGDFAFGTVNVANVAPLSTDVVGGSGADGGVGLGFTIGLMDMVTLGTVLYPVNAFGDKLGETGLTLQVAGIADMIDVAAFFMASEYDLSADPDNIDGDPVDDEGMNMGVSVKADLGAVALGAGFAMNMDTGGDNVSALQFDVAFNMVESLSAGLSFGCEDISDFMPASSLKLSASYALMDNLSVYGGVGIGLDFDNFEASGIDYDLGLTTSLKALAIQVGVSNNMDYMAPEDDFDDALFVKFSTSF
jgi:hypothetical protein